MAKKSKGESKKESGLYKDEESRKRAMDEIRLKEIEKNIIEEENSRLNALKIQNRWRDIMKIAKSEELKKELLTLQQVQSRKIDRKQATIKNLKTFLNESEDQYSNAVKHHLMNIDMLTGLQNSKMDTLYNQFQSDIAMLETEFNTERMKIQANHAKDRGEILGIIARADQEFEDGESDAKHEFSSVKDDVKNKVNQLLLMKNAEEKHALRIQLEGTVEELWKQFQLALNNYNSATEERKKQFEDLKSKDLKNSKEVEAQMKRLGKLQENIASLKLKMSNNHKEYDEKNNAVKSEKDKMQVQFQALKKRMNTFREEERAKLIELSLLSGKTIKTLKSQVERAENIIKLAEMNQKLETEEEKVIPFYEESKVPQIEEVKIAATELPKEFEGMSQFSKRFNKAYLDKLALDKKQERLMEENSNLKSVLKQYLDGISLSGDVLEKLNPLFVVNGKTNATIKPKGDNKIKYVEAQYASAALN